VQEIIAPSTRARGAHAFYPSLAIAPSLVDDEDDEGSDEEDDEREDMSTPIALIGLQGSINRLTDILINSITASIPSLATPTQSMATFTQSMATFTQSMATPTQFMATPEDLATMHRAEAIKRVQYVDDGLSTKEKVELIKQFSENDVVVGIYLSLSDQSLRQAWIRTKLLKSVSGGAAL